MLLAMLIELLPPWSLLSVFLLASFVLAVTPGPGVIYIVARSVAQGRRSGLASVAGVALGNFGNAVAASLGLAALFAASALAFSVVKYAGAGYLIYLGIKALRANTVISVMAQPEAAPLWPIFRDGVVVALLNPKTAIFFTAFLPQFMTLDARGHATLAQALSLSALFVVMAAVTDAMYALLAAVIAPRWATSPSAGGIARVTAGVSFIALGVFAALSGRKVS
jgi:threonine/homoserine/homoserine lactone efflux protein